MPTTIITTINFISKDPIKFPLRQAKNRGLWKNQSTKTPNISLSNCCNRFYAVFENDYYSTGKDFVEKCGS